MAKGQRGDAERERFWRGALGRFVKSGLSVREFCRRERLSEPSFYAWRRILRERDGGRREADAGNGRRRENPGSHLRRQACLRATHRQVGPGFIPVVLRDESAEHIGRLTDGGITVELRGGRVLRLPLRIEAQRVAELVRAVEQAAVAEGRP
jgi:transposase-like protein